MGLSRPVPGWVDGFGTGRDKPVPYGRLTRDGEVARNLFPAPQRLGVPAGWELAWSKS